MADPRRPRERVYEVIECPRCRQYWTRMTLAGNRCPYCRVPLALVELVRRSQARR